MRRDIIITSVATAWVGCAGFAPIVDAQQSAEQSAQERERATQEEQARQRASLEEQRAQERERAQEEQQRQRARLEEQRAQQRERAQEEQERQREESANERASLEAELARAREEMEEAARKVAELSSQFAAPYTREMTRQWRYRTRRAMLGLNPEDTELGVRVAGVSPNGPAAAAGIEVGDVILEIDGAALADPRVTRGGDQSPSELLLAQMGNVEPGESVTLKVTRDGREQELVVQTQERSGYGFAFGDFDLDLDFDELPRMPQSPRWSNFFRAGPWEDMQLVTLTPELGSYFGADDGILIVRGPENDALGLQDGDVILDIGGREPTTPEHAIRILSSFEEGETLRINVMRRQQRQALELKVPALSENE